MTVNNSFNNVGVMSSDLSLYENGCVQRFAEFLEPRDIGRCEAVCKLWTESFENQETWIRLSVREGIPFVEGQDRDRRADFKILYPMTISRKKISRFLGELVGEIPLISAVVFGVLNTPDPFEEGKSFKDTWVFVVDFPLIKRTAGEGTPLDLDKQENLIELPADKVQNGKELLIPHSLKNLRMLCSHPLEGKKNMPVFSKKHSSVEVFNQCSASSNKVSIFFMRRCIAKESSNMTYANQEILVTERGFIITPLSIRALFDAVQILESGTCPDSEKPRYTYARCSDIVRYGSKVYHACIGGFAPSSGARVIGSDCDIARIGVAPGVSAEVLRDLALEPLGLGEGH
jgi:hypothetical protein